MKELYEMSKKHLTEMLEICSREDICAKYKISLRTLSRILYERSMTKVNYGPKNITLEKAQKIRELYFNGDFTQQKLSEMYSISQSMICKIVNKMSHKVITGLNVSGTAEVKVGYNFNGD